MENVSDKHSIVFVTFLVEIVLHDVRELPDGLESLADLLDARLHFVDYRGVALGAGQVDGASLGRAGAQDHDQDENNTGNKDEISLQALTYPHCKKYVLQQKFIFFL